MAHAQGKGKQQSLERDALGNPGLCEGATGGSTSEDIHSIPPDQTPLHHEHRNMERNTPVYKPELQDNRKVDGTSPPPQLKGTVYIPPIATMTPLPLHLRPCRGFTTSIPTSNRSSRWPGTSTPCQADRRAKRTGMHSPIPRLTHTDVSFSEFFLPGQVCPFIAWGSELFLACRGGTVSAFSHCGLRCCVLCVVQGMADAGAASNSLALPSWATWTTCSSLR
ncbi:hypothetical protein QBC39DRAFT_60429 [Podospora conica]|nr:hypothetical protein QBC39DRAFT_60429 [Schizothecium conicum]